MSSQSSDIPSFFEDELKKALREQTYGIDSSKLLGSTALDATAEITIIEGATIKVMLFTSGFQVSSSCADKPFAGQFFAMKMLIAPHHSSPNTLGIIPSVVVLPW